MNESRLGIQMKIVVHTHWIAQLDSFDQAPEPEQLSDAAHRSNLPSISALQRAQEVHQRQCHVGLAQTLGI